MLKHHSFFSKINLTRDLSEIKIVDYKDQQDLFSKEGSLEKAYINITEQMNSQVSLNRKIDKNVIINKNILKLYPSASLLQE